jgi:hypothetical protein
VFSEINLFHDFLIYYYELGLIFSQGSFNFLEIQHCMSRKGFAKVHSLMSRSSLFLDSGFVFVCSENCYELLQNLGMRADVDFPRANADLPEILDLLCTSPIQSDILQV